MTAASELFVDGHHLETFRIPPPDGGGTIVFLHEGLGSVSMWRDFPATLAARTKCGALVYSRYGHGQSDRLAEPRDVDYMHHEAFAVLPALLRAAAIERPILFGHSDGASIALLFAGRYPQVPAALILEAPHLFVEEVTVASIAAIKENFAASCLQAKLAYHHRDAASTFYGWNDIWLAPRFRAWNIEADVAQLQCPVLVMQGRDDEYGTLEQVDRLQALQPAAGALLLERCGHAPHRDQAETVLSASAAFIEGLARHGAP